jgi:hypothetical protein
MSFRSGIAQAQGGPDRFGVYCGWRDWMPAGTGAEMNAMKRHLPVNPAAKAHLDELLDDALAQSFPASDPIAVDFDAPRDEGVVEEDEK